MKQSWRYESDEDDTTHKEDYVRRYREIVGSLVYAMTWTRPDLAWIVTKLLQHLANPSKADWMTVKHVLRYIKGTVDYKLIFKKSTDAVKLVGHSDSDYASTKEDRIGGVPQDVFTLKRAISGMEE